MIETVNLQVKKTIGFKIKGKLDDVTFIKSTAEIMDALDEGKCNLYMEVESVKGVTFEIVWDSIKLGLRHLGEYLNKIEKIAVVTDIKWI